MNVMMMTMITVIEFHIVISIVKSGAKLAANIGASQQ